MRESSFLHSYHVPPNVWDEMFAEGVLRVGRHFTDCTPVKGTYKGSSQHTLEVSVSIGNGELENEEFNITPGAFSYKTRHPAPQTNSYRRFLEMQQQQQQ